MRHKFQSEQWLPYSRERLFAFFGDPANLPPLMPLWQRAKVERAQLVQVPGTGGVVAGAGSLLTISFRPVPLLPLRIEWDALITDFQWNDFFCDEQVRGPFKYFRHCHRIREEVREGIAGGVVSDSVEYELPMGVLGDLMDKLAVKRQIRGLFAYRKRRLPVLLSKGEF